MNSQRLLITQTPRKLTKETALPDPDDAEHNSTGF